MTTTTRPPTANAEALARTAYGTAAQMLAQVETEAMLAPSRRADYQLSPGVEDTTWGRELLVVDASAPVGLPLRYMVVVEGCQPHPIERDEAQVRVAKAIWRALLSGKREPQFNYERMAR